MKNTKYSTASIPIRLAERIDKVIDEEGFWPSRSAFVREACLEKLEKLKEKKHPTNLPGTGQPEG